MAGLNKSVLCGLSVLICAVRAQAIDISLPPVNLGDTSFEDGIAFPGWLAEENVGYYHSGQFTDHHGAAIPGSNQLTSVSAVTHVAYLSKWKLLGGFYGSEFLLPVADVDANTSFGPKDRRQGLGDLVLSPVIIQWTDHHLLGMPSFHRFVISVTLPTGTYDRDRAVNSGSNLVSINPYYAFTLIPTKNVEFSARLHLLWNSRNNDPFVGLGATSIQPGQAFHANYAVSSRIADGVRIGINGYALQQFTADKVNRHRQGNSEERVFGIGPGLKMSGHGVALYINSYFESGAQNRPQGAKVVLRISKVL